ncbi:hypothetical protein [Vibrio phage vB_VmeM-Yong XC32]|nr:hypothetical protein [Vibrio phage vB_VmeM-Yong XC31]QAX96541.1 hypothetical protein [Vibrio phage vB_VmeM-Yong XC32]QAX96859.1 hypothetical protein [Vibrio phage vB_VmeM-Yong MS31]QAX97164.1 hypothetical protein [Vibrio phage vB_VmeM-Yong MS32]
MTIHFTQEALDYVKETKIDQLWLVTIFGNVSVNTYDFYSRALVGRPLLELLTSVVNLGGSVVPTFALSDKNWLISMNYPILTCQTFTGHAFTINVENRSSIRNSWDKDGLQEHFDFHEDGQYRCQVFMDNEQQEILERSPLFFDDILLTYRDIDVERTSVLDSASIKVAVTEHVFKQGTWKEDYVKVLDGTPGWDLEVVQTNMLLDDAVVVRHYVNVPGNARKKFGKNWYAETTYFGGGEVAWVLSGGVNQCNGPTVTEFHYAPFVSGNGEQGFSISSRKRSCVEADFSNWNEKFRSHIHAYKVVDFMEGLSLIKE